MDLHACNPLLCRVLVYTIQDLLVYRDHSGMGVRVIMPTEQLTQCFEQLLKPKRAMVTHFNLYVFGEYNF